MRELTIAMALIEQGDSYVLQRRGAHPEIGAAGLIGCFGGKVEPEDKTPRRTIAREIGEETSLNFFDDAFTELGEVRVVSDYKREPVAIHGYSYRLMLGSHEIVKALEGELVLMPKALVKDNLSDMTTGTRAVFEQYVLGKTK